MNEFYKYLVITIILFSHMNLSNAKDNDIPLRISKQLKVPSTLEEVAWDMISRIEAWKPAETAIIICDMWDRHWCDDATARVAEIAPEMNKVLAIAREKGVKIVHAPSDCMGYYANYPGRKEALKYKDAKIAALADGSKLPSEANAPWPIDQSDEGCENAGCKPHKAWTKQIDALTITDQDLISDSGAEIGAYFKKKGVKNVILMGVHTNMCVIGRSFGLRAMTRMGMNVVLMRDMTDLMYNSKMPPYVNHFTGLDLIVDYIETYVCPSIVSTDFTGKKQFRFKGDTRPRIAFVTAESEYRANQRLPEFARELTMKNIHCDFALGIPIMTDAKPDAAPKVKAEYAAYGMPVDNQGKITVSPTRHNIENLQILNDADLAIFFIRRRALEPEKMAIIRDYVASGRPVLGIRTASHAFDANANVPRQGGGIEAAKENASEFLAQWKEFDKDVLGGNYQGHYGHLNTGTDVSIVPGMEGHPLLKGVEPKFNSLNWLYKNRPLRSDKIQVLLLGSNPGVPDEPVLWVNNKNVIYTSLGHWDDWKIESFRNLMLNAVDYLLSIGVSPPQKTLVWSDEFDYEGLPDKSKWNYEEGFIRNREPQYYTKERPENAYVTGGNLIITAIKEDFKNAKYTSASINTKGKFEFHKGRIEVRAKLPSGRGVWPAIWTLGANINQVRWPQCGEIDIMEYWGHNPNSVHANVHTGDYNHSKGKGRGGNISFEEPWKDFHIFAVEWYDDRMDFYFDDKLYYTCRKLGEGAGEWPFDAPQYLLINLALTGGQQGIDDAVFPAKYIIDYVRIYSLK